MRSTLMGVSVYKVIVGTLQGVSNRGCTVNMRYLCQDYENLSCVSDVGRRYFADLRVTSD